MVNLKWLWLITHKTMALASLLQIFHLFLDSPGGMHFYSGYPGLHPRYPKNHPKTAEQGFPYFL